MPDSRSVVQMDLDKVELVEKAAFTLVVKALEEYKSDAAEIFSAEEDLPQDIAEDIVREAIDNLGVSRIKERLYGKVDVKKAIYLFLPEAVPVALMVDAKAEKNGTTATIQMSQTSMTVKIKRKGKEMVENGKLDTEFVRNKHHLHVVTIIVKLEYEESDKHYKLNNIVVACIPSGRLQDRYNPDTGDGIWRLGRDSPKRGEDFRIRLSFPELEKRATWRVHKIPI